MGFNDSLIDWRELVKMTNEGLTVPDYPTLRKSISNAFRTVYGNDIDLSTGTADGIYIDMYCLIINNILQSLHQVYVNMDINKANSKYLDTLCALSNIFRRGSTKSSAIITCTLDESAVAPYEPEKDGGYFSVLDDNGVIWTHKRNVKNLLIFEPGVTQKVIVECENNGPIEAPAGSINRLVSTEVVMNIEQENAASVGENEETDENLRSRRNLSLVGQSQAMPVSLRGNILNQPYIRDCKIYNNISGASISTKDGQTVANHNVYIIVRYASYVLTTTDYDAEFGEVIYNKLPIGILTQAATNEIAHRYEIPEINGIPKEDFPIAQVVYWREASPVHPKIIITLEKYENYVESEESIIKSKLISYLNNLEIGTNLDSNELKYRIRYYDPLYKNTSTFSIQNITVNNTSFYNNLDNYYNYTESDIEVHYV